MIFNDDAIPCIAHVGNIFVMVLRGYIYKHILVLELLLFMFITFLVMVLRGYIYKHILVLELLLFMFITFLVMHYFNSNYANAVLLILCGIQICLHIGSSVTS